MRETEAGNVAWVCRDHAPKPMVMPPDLATLTDKEVKVSFKAKDGRIEHMWVKVVAIDDATQTFAGWLNNDPQMNVGYKWGDVITRPVTDIEAVFE